MPEAFAARSRDIEAMNPGWTVHRWTPDTIGALVAQRHYDEAGRYVAPHRLEVYRSNLVRYELLATFGGVYVDVDLVAVSPLDPTGDVLVTANQANPDPAVLGCIPGHPLAGWLTAELQRAGPMPVRTCPGCEQLNAVLERHPLPVVSRTRWFAS